MAAFTPDDAVLQIRETPSYITNLGPQSTSLTLMTGSYGKDRQGRDVMYKVVQGDPAQFLVSDVKTKAVLGKHPLVALDGSNVTAAWAITTATDGKVYVGSTPNGTLFQYDPATEAMRTIGKPVPTDTVIWVLVPGPNGKVYGGTGYSQSVFEYDPATDITKTLAPFKTASKEQHARSLTYDSDHNVLYVGGSDVAKLYKYDLATGQKTELTPPEFAGKTSVYDLHDHVRVRSRNGCLGSEKQHGIQHARLLSCLPGRAGVLHFLRNSAGWPCMNMTRSRTRIKSTGADVKGVGVAFGYVTLNLPDYPGTTLVGLAGNQDTRQITYSDDKFPTADYAHSNPRLMLGTDGNIYGSIYLGYVADKTYTSKLFLMVADTKQVTILLESNVVKLAQVELKAERTELRRGETTSYTYQAILEKGRVTRELSGATIEYISSRPKVAELTADGEIHANHPGQTDLSVRITLNGVTVQSAPINVKVTGPEPK